MKHKMLKPALLLALSLVIALPLAAQSQRGGRCGGEKAQAILDDLKLSAEQETQMQELRYDRELAGIDFKSELQKERLKLKRLRQADEPNKKKLYAQVEKVGAVEIKISKSRIDHMLKVRGVLTDEQFKIFSKSQRGQKGRCDGKPGGMGDKKSKSSRRNRF